MNAAAALVVGARARDFKEGVALAAQSIDAGAARGKLEALVALSREMAPEKKIRPRPQGRVGAAESATVDGGPA